MFGVLVVTPNRQRCLSLARELRKCESPELWRMVAVTDFTPERMLTEPIFYGTDNSEPRRLLRINLPPVPERTAEAIQTSDH